MSHKKDRTPSTVEPASKDGLLALLAILEPIEDTFPDIDEPLPSLGDAGL